MERGRFGKGEIMYSRGRYRISVRAVHNYKAHGVPRAATRRVPRLFFCLFLLFSLYQRSRPPRHPRHRRRRRRRPWQTLLALSISPSFYYASSPPASSSSQLFPLSLQSPRRRRLRRLSHLSSSHLKPLVGLSFSLFFLCLLSPIFSMDSPSSSLPYSPKTGPIGPESKSMRSQASSPSLVWPLWERTRMPSACRFGRSRGSSPRFCSR